MVSPTTIVLIVLLSMLNITASQFLGSPWINKFHNFIIINLALDPSEHPLYSSNNEMNPWTGVYGRQQRAGVNSFFRYIQRAETCYSVEYPDQVKEDQKEDGRLKRSERHCRRWRISKSQQWCQKTQAWRTKKSASLENRIMLAQKGDEFKYLPAVPFKRHRVKEMTDISLENLITSFQYNLIHEKSRMDLKWQNVLLNSHVLWRHN